MNNQFWPQNAVAEGCDVARNVILAMQALDLKAECATLDRPQQQFDDRAAGFIQILDVWDMPRFLAILLQL